MKEHAEKHTKKKEDDRQVSWRVILSGAAILLLAGVFVVAVMIYGFDADNRLTEKTSRLVPFPVAVWGANWVSENELRGELASVRSFYENQDFSDLGMRVDFNTDDGKKRLAIKKKDILQKLIEDRLIENEAKKRGLTITKDDISQAVSRKMDEYGSEQYLKDNMQKLYGWSIQDFEDKIVKPDMYRQALAQSVRESDPSQKEAKDKIDAALRELDSGADFADVATKYSDGESAKSGGELGWFNKTEMLPEIASVVFNLEKGDRSQVIESSLGYHIVLVEDKKTVDGTDSLRLRQVFVRTDSFSSWLTEYLKKFDIHILSRGMYWNRSDGQVEFRDAQMRDFENNLDQNSPGDISVLF